MGDARKGVLTTLIHVNMRMHAFLTITTNICWEGCEKEGAVAEKELKMQFLRERGKLGRDVLFLT